MGRTVTFRCAWCDTERQTTVSAVGRAAAINAPLYCNRACAGLARRTNKSIAQKKAEKSEYDSKRRARYRAYLKRQKAERYRLHHDREKERAARQKRMPQHIEYCRQPAYREKKRVYDENVRALKYGQFAECYRLFIELKKEIVARVPSYYERHRETEIERNRRYRNAKRERAYS